jgi:hypothetical protein
VRAERRRRRLRRGILTALLLLLLLLRCECDPPAPPPPAPPPPEEPPAPPAPAPKPKAAAPAHKRRPLKVHVEPQPRAPMNGGGRAAPGWLTEFRLQVAARSQRLAQCFRGAEGPGALRWTTSVNPESGAATDHELEPVGPHADLSREQRDCVVQVLTQPPYRIGAPRDQALPDRVSLLIEF